MIAPKHRGKALGMVQAGAPIGSGIAALLAGPVAAHFDPNMGWRFAFWVGLLPALLIFFVRRGSDDAEIFKAARAKQIAQGRQQHIAAIFTRRIVGLTLLTALLSFGVQGAAYSVANFLTSFMTSERGLTQSVASYCVLMNSVGGFIGCLVNALLSDKYGRRTVFRLFGVGFLIMASIYPVRSLGPRPHIPDPDRPGLWRLPVRHVCLVRPLFHRTLPNRAARIGPVLRL